MGASLSWNMPGVPATDLRDATGEHLHLGQHTLQNKPSRCFVELRHTGFGCLRPGHRAPLVAGDGPSRPLRMRFLLCVAGYNLSRAALSRTKWLGACSWGRDDKRVRSNIMKLIQLIVTAQLCLLQHHSHDKIFFVTIIIPTVQSLVTVCCITDGFDKVGRG